jgi:DNA-binding transcriptional LysR family regulator
MDRFQAITAFTRVVETGSFARAADRLGVSVSAVSRHVAELESHLGARLLNRTTRRLSLTESGRAFHERCVQLLEDLEEAEEVVGAGTRAPRGTLRITCGTTFGVRHVAGVVAAYAARHPQVRFDLDLSDRAVDLVEEGFDLAIRIGAVGSPALIARRIGTTSLVCCASPAYLARHGTPHVPDDLAQHECLTYVYAPDRDVWRFRGAGAEHAVAVSGPVRANNGEMLTALALAGMGVDLEPDIVVAPYVRDGTLVRLLPEYRPASMPIHAVYPSRRHLSAKVRSFIDFLAARFATEPAWELDRHPRESGDPAA